MQVELFPAQGRINFGCLHLGPTFRGNVDATVGLGIASGAAGQPTASETRLQVPPRTFHGPWTPYVTMSTKGRWGGSGWNCHRSDSATLLPVREPRGFLWQLGNGPTFLLIWALCGPNSCIRGNVSFPFTRSHILPHYEILKASVSFHLRGPYISATPLTPAASCLIYTDTSQHSTLQQKKQGKPMARERL